MPSLVVPPAALSLDVGCVDTVCPAYLASPPSPVPLDLHPSPPSQDTRQSLPRRLPRLPLPPPSRRPLAVDAELQGVPLPFVRDSLAALAPPLLAGTNSITPLVPLSSSSSSSSSGALPPVLECTFTPPPHLPEGYALPPTHLLALTFPPAPSLGPDEDGDDNGAQRVLVPVHALPWALASSVLAHLLYPPPSPPPPPQAAPGAPVTPPSSPPLGARPSPHRAPPAPAPTVSLPVIPLALPSLTGFTLLHASLHSSRPSHALSPLSRLPPSERLRALEGAWKVSCALGVGGEGAREWEGEMARGWGAAVRELEEGEEARRAGWGRA